MWLCSVEESDGRVWCYGQWCDNVEIRTGMKVCAFEDWDVCVCCWVLGCDCWVFRTVMWECGVYNCDVSFLGWGLRYECLVLRTWMWICGVEDSDENPLYKLVSLSLCFRDKDEASSTGCVYSVLVSRVVCTVPAVAWVRQVLFHIEGTSHQVVCKRVPSSSTVLVLVVWGLRGS